MITPQAVPEKWSINSDEIAPYIFRVKAIAMDGRAIEATGSDEDDLLKSVIASVHQFETNARQA